jgi:hypothetical protein
MSIEARPACMAFFIFLKKKDTWMIDHSFENNGNRSLKPAND